MRIVEGDKEFNFDILRYQYEKYDNSYDANWLMLKFDYSDKEQNNNGQDPCILAWELEDIFEGLSEILSSKRSTYFSDLLEPYLKLTAVKHDEAYIIAASFYYYVSNDDCRSWEMCQVFNKEDFSLWVNELQNVVEKYPVREYEEGE